MQITKGGNREQKATIVREITETLMKALGKKPEHIHVVIQNVELEDWGYKGVLSDELGGNKK